jgi:hypothetical protein
MRNGTYEEERDHGSTVRAIEEEAADGCGHEHATERVEGLPRKQET